MPQPLRLPRTRDRDCIRRLHRDDTKPRPCVIIPLRWQPLPRRQCLRTRLLYPTLCPFIPLRPKATCLLRGSRGKLLRTMAHSILAVPHRAVRLRTSFLPLLARPAWDSASTLSIWAASHLTDLRCCRASRVWTRRRYGKRCLPPSSPIRSRPLAPPLPTCIRQTTRRPPVSVAASAGQQLQMLALCSRPPRPATLKDLSVSLLRVTVPQHRCGSMAPPAIQEVGGSCLARDLVLAVERAASREMGNGVKSQGTALIGARTLLCHSISR